MSLQNWLSQNKATLRKYSPDELAFMAHLCGFDWDEIHRLVPEAYNDLQTHTTAQIRANWYVDREIDFIQNRGPKPKLEAQWHDLWAYENGQMWIE
jgi:hypothetical protein